MIPFRKKTVPGTVPVLFLHIQKTAGSSIVDVARRYYGESVTSHGEYRDLALDQIRHRRFVSGHFGYQFARNLMRERFSFTVLRDPIERVLSMYYFCRSRDPSEFIIYRRAHELDLHDFLLAGFSDPWIKKNIWNNQVWQLAHGYGHLDQRTISDFDETELLDLAKQHLDEFSYVGFTETLHADAAAIFSALGIPAVPRIPNANPTPKRPRVDELSLQDKALIEELTVLSRKFYEHARARKPIATQSGTGSYYGYPWF
jgi:hypothetical protein